MIEEQDDAEDSPRHYVPSGRVNLASLVPILAASAWVALGMAFVLLFAERRLYLPFLTPMLLGLPVFGVIGLSVRWGQCRNRGMGGLIGVILVFVYYAGYWELSYLTNVVARPRMVAACGRIGRLPGLPGYVVYRCKYTRPLDFRRGRPNGRPPSLWGTLFGAILIGGETFVITAMGARVGRSAASCPFSERSRRWTSRFEFRLPLATREAVEDAIARGDWAALADLPRASSIVNVQADSLLLLLDYVPDVPDEPAYLTLIAGQGGTIETLARQRLVPATDVEAIAVEFPELKVRPERGVEAGSNALRSGRTCRGAPRPGPAGFPRPGRGGQPESGGEAPPQELPDRPGLALSARLGRWCAGAESRGTPCRPAPGRHQLGYVREPRRGLPGRPVRQPPSRTIGRGDARRRCELPVFRAREPGQFRGGRSTAQAVPHPAPRPPLRFPDPRRSGLTLHGRAYRGRADVPQGKLSPEDIGIAFCDAENRRLLVEGVSHRYVIRGEDVTCLWPLQAHSIISARIDYEIGGERYSLVLARRNPWFSVWAPSGNRSIAGFVDSLSRTLGCEPGMWDLLDPTP